MNGHVSNARTKGRFAKLKKSLAIILSVMMIITLMPVMPAPIRSAAGNEVHAASDYDRAVSNFRNDSRFRNGAVYNNCNGPRIANYRSSGCCAYCADFCKYVFGKDSPRSGQYFSNRNEIRAGDIIHWEYKNAKGEIYDQHWYVVLYRNGNQLTTAEGAYGPSLKPPTPENKKVVRISDSAYTVSGTKFTYGYHNTGKPVDTDTKPIGFHDTVSTAPGQLTVTGWAVDPDKPSAAISVHVYIDGAAGSGTFIGSGVANQSRPDISGVGAGIYHGYKITIDTSKFQKMGNRKIYIHAININKNGTATNPANNILLSNTPRTADIKPAITYNVNTGEATNIKNTSAKISGSISPAGNVGRWGFYLGTSENDMNSHKYTVSTTSTASSNMSAQVEKYRTEGLEPGTKYYYKVWAYVNDKEKTGSTATFTTTAIKPEIPVLKVNSSSKEIGIGDAPGFSWATTDETDYYKMYLYGPDGSQVAESNKITGTKYAFGAVESAGTYTAKIESFNAVGSRGKSEAVSFTVHDDVTVTFKDADSFVDVGDDYTPATIAETAVHWGHDASLPADPEHTGYTFNKWEGNYKAVKSDTTVKAVYDINEYTVKYADSETGEILGTEKVEYYSAANLVDYPVPAGYAKTGYDGWDKDYHHITEDTILSTCIGWYDEELPIYATIQNAVREYDSEDSSDDGYTVTISLRNWDTSTTKGRAVVALKTREGKLLTSTESAAFSIKKSTTKNIEVFVPYENAATIAEAYVIGQYKDAVPIATTTQSNNAQFEIDQTNTLTSWSEEDPGNDVINKETRTEYRYSDKQTTTSYNTSLAGYTQDGGSWVKSGSGNIDYVSSFPSGISKSNKYYTALNKSPATAYENATNKRTVSTSTYGYLYWHWCRNNKSTPGNYLISDCYTSEFNTCHAFVSIGGPQGYDANAKAHYCVNAVECKTTYWWMGKQICTSTNIPIYRCSYTDYKKLFNYYKWSDWSDWSTTPVSSSSNRKVETRTVYRYQPTGTMDEDNSGEARTVSGSLGSQFAGKEATLFIYKVNEASDFTNEYVAQTKLNDNGDYEFNFKLREEPTAETGDFTVVLGVQGTSTAIYLDTIKAPKKEYKVNFYDYDGTLISEQTVEEGENAELPDETQLTREGYTFTKWTDTNMNVREDREIYAEYKINTYNVVFVDWKANTVSVEKFDYGAALVTPQAEEPEEGQTVEWDAVADGIQTVTDDMVVTTRYSPKELEVAITNENGTVQETKTVPYGKAVVLPDKQSDDKKTFLGWQDISDGEEAGITDTLITKNAILCPVYEFNETVADPTADVASGVYDQAQQVTLSCETEGADIYYTTDGSDPTGINGVLYSGPIEIDDAVNLQFYATKAEMNDSAVQSVLYSVNYDGATSKWMTMDELPEEVKNNTSAYNVQAETGYRYKDVKKVTTVNEASSLEGSGWTLKEGEDKTYTDYTEEWADSVPSNTGDYLGIDVKTEPVYDEAYQYRYSHYVYEDGVTKYAPEAVDGFDCTYEETEPFDHPLNLAGFDPDYYVYDGQLWFNQTRSMEQVQVGTKYKWRYEQAEYTKWSDWTTEDPAAGESRESESARVYRYVRHNNYIVTVHYGDESWSYLAEEGSLADISNFKNKYEYYFDNVELYKDAGFSEAWDIDSDTVTENVDLYIKAQKKVFDVTFLDKDGEVISVQNVEYGEAAEPPEAPAVDGFIFLGWSSDDYKNVNYESMQIIAQYVAEDEYATVELDNNKLTLYKGKSADLTAVVSPSSKADAELTWTSSDDSVAMVSDTGTVTGLAAGTADITVKVNETGETASCKVTVKVNTDTTLSLIKNDKIKVDKLGYLRGIKGGVDTFADVKEYFENDDIICVNKDGDAVADDDFVGTGCKIQLMGSSGVLDEIEVVVTGDVNGDGDVSNVDVSMLLRHLMNKIELNGAPLMAADANGDGEVWNRDAILISRALVGKAEL